LGRNLTLIYGKKCDFSAAGTKKKNGWVEQNDEYFRWGLLWIRKSRAYIEFLEGVESATGIDVGSALSNQTAEEDSITQYDVALSFAGEDRGYARELADLLRSSKYTVFYDEYEKAKLWGRKLYTHLSDIYQNKAKYCVMFVSKHYAKKLWTKKEREAAQARAFTECENYILPVRLDDTAIPGLEPTVGYLDSID